MTDTRKCQSCGKNFIPAHPTHPICRECHHKQRATSTSSPQQAGQTQPVANTPSGQQQSGNRQQYPSQQKPRNFTIDEQYLAEGYFEQRKGRSVVRDEVIDSLAEDVALILLDAKPKITTHQIRRFYNTTRNLNLRLIREHNFENIRIELLSLKKHASIQTARELVPEPFLNFITKNIELAKKDERSFRLGFLPHFESVLAYFTYHDWRRRKKN